MMKFGHLQCGCVDKAINVVFRLSNQGSKQMSFATTVVTVSTGGIPTIVNALQTTLGAIVKAKWIIVKTNLVAMAPPAGDMLEGTSVM